MRIHILGIGGTFMGGLALLARARGFTVTGSDQGIYPPMSDQLAASGIALTEGYQRLPDPAPDLAVIGNVLSRGNPAVEEVLDRGIPYTSGPAFLAEHILTGQFVMAVAGTHGKTTVASLMSWILDQAGFDPGFLIGGIAANFGISARVGTGGFFVVEADEYDTAFFDKRPKFLHYRPRTLVLNNLEYDHADIYPDLAAIEREFGFLLRTVPRTGKVLVNAQEPALQRVLGRGIWSAKETFADPDGWWAEPLNADYSHFRVHWQNSFQGEVRFGLAGRHNMYNALAAIAACRHAGVPVDTAIGALATFAGVKRRLEVRGSVRGITVYDDFAHHPTAIATTIEGLRGRIGKARLVAVLEPRSNTMRLGVHRDTLATSLTGADRVFLYAPPDIGWDVAGALDPLGDRVTTAASYDALLIALQEELKAGDHVLIMSNGGFGGLHDRLLRALAGR